MVKRNKDLGGSVVGLLGAISEEFLSWELLCVCVFLYLLYRYMQPEGLR